ESLSSSGRPVKDTVHRHCSSIVAWISISIVSIHIAFHYADGIEVLCGDPQESLCIQPVTGLVTLFFEALHQFGDQSLNSCDIRSRQARWRPSEGRVKNSQCLTDLSGLEEYVATRVGQGHTESDH